MYVCTTVVRVQLSYTTLHRTVLIISLILQTVIIAQMLSRHHSSVDVIVHGRWLRAVAIFEATEAADSVVFTTLASVKTIISTTLNIKYEAHDYIAETHNGNCNRLSSSFKRRCSYALV